MIFLLFYGCIYIVDGNWTAWSPWSACSKSCKDQQIVPLQVRTRSCTKPSPVNGGKICGGESKNRRFCDWLPQCPGIEYCLLVVLVPYVLVDQLMANGGPGTSQDLASPGTRNLAPSAVRGIRDIATIRPQMPMAGTAPVSERR